MKALTLSIVIPVYNEENHLKACLDSIANQTVMPDEVIVVDNNSRDHSVEVAKSYPFVRVIHESEQGIVHTRNTGFDAVASDIIGRIDGDTVLPRDWVRRVKHFYSVDHNADRCLTGGGYFYNMRLPRFNGWLQSQVAYRANRFITGYYILWGSNMAMPRSVWHAVREKTCPRDDIHEDIDLAIHVHRLGYKITYHAKLRVGVKLKRAWSDRQHLKTHMRRWPTTLKVHGYKLWWMGIIGNLFLWFIIQPLFWCFEKVAQIIGRKTPNDV